MTRYCLSHSMRHILCRALQKPPTSHSTTSAWSFAAGASSSRSWGRSCESNTATPFGKRSESWREEEKRNKRFYRLSTVGKAALKQLTAEWKAMNAALGEIL